VIVTATEWANFFALRDNDEAQPEIHTIAAMMHAAYIQNTLHARCLKYDEWHLPMVSWVERMGDDTNGVMGFDDASDIEASVARCARVSYETHEGKIDRKADLVLYRRLVSSGHMSPLEHAARPMTYVEERLNPFCGNFRGWVQHRKEIPHEDVFRK
jgi:thymidylate synthase ThyX